MTNLLKPLPALYTVYVLRSTVRHASLYIGSTPNPPRRLRQHNGETVGGAVRTSRDRLRPWEMVALVSGFPSAIAALKFEWALANSHRTLHIPAESRPGRKKKSKSEAEAESETETKKKKKTKTKRRRPQLSMRSVMASIRLLTGVTSFARWPLTLHLFAEAARRAWVAAGVDGEATKGLRVRIDLVEDDDDNDDDDEKPKGGIHELPLDYAPWRDYVVKARDATTATQHCVHCGERLVSGRGLHAVCPGSGCVAVGHLDCWGRYALANEGGVVGDGADGGAVLPRACSCPECGGEVRWADMVRELTLRIRGRGEVEKLLEVKKRRGRKKVAE